jgi:hypothetical protein
MQKTCFVIMPITDADPYENGHFKRVYEYIIKPACFEAGFQPVRGDDVLNTNYIALDVIKKLINSDMAICDLSSRNPNVFYELGIRQAFNLPVTLVRDSLTERVFDIQGFRDIEYDENLRIDNVENTISIIAETIKNTYETKGEEVNSLISLLGIQPAKITESREISKDTELILNTLASLGSRIISLEKIIPTQHSQKPTSPFSVDDSGLVWRDLTSTETRNLEIGDFIEHQKFGRGRVISREGIAQNPVATIAFESGESKKLMLNYAKLKKLFNPE